MESIKIESIKIESKRAFKNSDKKPEITTRYYISSLNETAESYQRDIRAHWGIENKLHWILDVGFSEDDSQKRSKNTAQNYSILLKMALNIFKNDTSTKQGIAGKRPKATWNEDYLKKLLKNYCWIWVAVDRYGKRFINFIIGDRSKRTARDLREDIKHHKMNTIASDY